MHTVNRATRTAKWSIRTRFLNAWWLNLLIVLSAAHPAVAGPVPERIDLPGPFPYGLAQTGSKLWCVDFETGDLYCVDPAAGAVQRTCRLPLRSPAGLCACGSQLFAVTESGIHRIDPCTGRCCRAVTFKLPAPTGLATDGRHFYAADRRLQAVTVFDARTGKQVRRFATPGRSPRGMTYHDGSLWLVDSSDRAVYRLDPCDGHVQAAFVSPEGEPRGVECVDGRWWFSVRNGGRLVSTRVEQLGPEVPGNAMRSNPLHVRVHYTHQLENHSPKPIEDVEICLAVPPETPRQHIEHLEFAPSPDEIRSDRFGQKVAVFRFPKLEPEQKAEVGWTVTARLWAIRYTPDATCLAPPKDAPSEIVRTFTQDAAVLGLDLPEIKKAAAAAAKNAENSLALVASIRDYVMQRVHYVRDGRWDPAVEVLKRGEGSCSEYSYAFTALARSLGLPVRFVGSTAYRPPKNDAAEDKSEATAGRYEDRVFHRWVEVYLPPYGWLPVDANRDDRDEPPFPRRYFLALSENLLVLSKTNWGDEENLGANYHSCHRWKPGENDRSECRVKSRHAAVWQRLPDDE